MMVGSGSGGGAGGGNGGSGNGKHSSSHINKAYTTLRDPLSRAEYLLQLRGVSPDSEAIMADDDGGHGGGGGGEVLMQVMEEREAIEAVSREEELEPLKRRNDARIEACLRALEEAFCPPGGGPSGGGEIDLPTALRETVKLRYWVNIGQSLRYWDLARGSAVLSH